MKNCEQLFFSSGGTDYLVLLFQFQEGIESNLVVLGMDRIYLSLRTRSKLVFIFLVLDRKYLSSRPRSKLVFIFLGLDRKYLSSRPRSKFSNTSTEDTGVNYATSYAYPWLSQWTKKRPPPWKSQTWRWFKACTETELDKKWYI